MKHKWKEQDWMGTASLQWCFWDRQVSPRLGFNQVTSIKEAIYQGSMMTKTSVLPAVPGALMNVTSSNTHSKTHQQIHLVYVRGTSHAWMVCCLLSMLLTLNPEQVKLFSWIECMLRVLENQASELTKWKIKLGWVRRVDHEICDDIQKKN